jgi:SAM-dependent methyltransferase
MSWFKDWFNSRYYHLLYKNRDESEASGFIDKLEEFLGFKTDDKILDLACGKGRHAIYLNQKGFDVTGIDLSEESIAFAKKFENQHLHFLVQDMRTELGTNSYDFILNLFTSFGYFETEEENVNALVSIEKALKPEGVFVLDFFNSHKIINEIIPHQVKEVEGIKFEIRKEVVDGFIIKNIYFEDLGVKHHYFEKVRAFSFQDLASMLKKVDLKLIHVLGDYALQKFDPTTSDRLILVAQKSN